MSVDDFVSGRSVELLKELHILTRDGRLNQDSRRKLKQVSHLLQFIEPLLAQVEHQSPVVVDHGAGKSYLGFMLYDQFFKMPKARELTGWVHGIESRPELVDRSTALAKRFGFERMAFHALNTQDALSSVKLPSSVDVVTALHACNTATDDAISFGMQKGAKHIVIVPCCQAEIASLLKENKSQQRNLPLGEIWRHALHTREFGAHLTNVLRCLAMEAQGYKVTVTELVGWEHSMKNELILASKHQNSNPQARSRLVDLLEQFGLMRIAHRFGISDL